MKLVKKEYVKVLEWAFKIAYLFLGLATFNTFLYDSQVQPMLVRICLVLGVLALLEDFSFSGITGRPLIGSCWHCSVSAFCCLWQ